MTLSSSFQIYISSPVYTPLYNTLLNSDCFIVNTSTIRQNRLKMAKACNNPFVLVNEDNTCELIGTF